MSALRELHHSLEFFKSHSAHTVKLWNNRIIQKCGEGKGFYGFAVVCNLRDKAEKPLRREQMSSPDGGIRGGQRTILEETRKMNSVHFRRCCLLAIIVKYSRQSLRGSGSDTFSFLSRRRKCEGCSITSAIHCCQTSTCSGLQTFSAQLVSAVLLFVGVRTYAAMFWCCCHEYTTGNASVRSARLVYV